MLRDADPTSSLLFVSQKVSLWARNQNSAEPIGKVLWRKIIIYFKNTYGLFSVPMIFIWKVSPLVLVRSVKWFRQSKACGFRRSLPLFYFILWYDSWMFWYFLTFLSWRPKGWIFEQMCFWCFNIILFWFLYKLFDIKFTFTSSIFC